MRLINHLSKGHLLFCYFYSLSLPSLPLSCLLGFPTLPLAQQAPVCCVVTKCVLLLLLLPSHFSRVQLWRPHRWQPTRLPRRWDSPGKNTGVGCHFLLQCMKAKSESEVAQSCPTLSDPMDCSPPGSSSMGFSRQEYWSGVPLLCLIYPVLYKKNERK